MIELEKVSFTYENASRGLAPLSLLINSGEVVCLCGISGSGKTTATRLINGLVPHFFEGDLIGKIKINNGSTSDLTLYDLAEQVGSVFQNPRSQFFSLNTTNELAFGLENQNSDPDFIKKRIQEVAEEFDIVPLMNRPIFKLSGGEKQIIACAAISVADPKIIVLDEPSSNLDTQAINQLKEVIRRWKSQGKTIVIAEHRLFYLVDIADRFLYFSEGQLQEEFSAQELLTLSTEDLDQRGLRTLTNQLTRIEESTRSDSGKLVFQNFHFRYKRDDREALKIDKLEIETNSITAIVGHNGAGKSTLARCLCGLEKSFRGEVTTPTGKWDAKKLKNSIYMVFQDVNCQLFTESVNDEILLSNKNIKKLDVTAIIQKLGLEGMEERHPLSLSGGEKQRLAIASALASDRDVFIFDEPTSGLDGKHMKQVAQNLQLLKSIGKTILLISHDYELISLCAENIVELANGELVRSYPLTNENVSELNQFFNEAKDWRK